MSTYKGTEVFILLIVTLSGVLCSVVLHKPLVLGFLPGFLILLVLTWNKNIPVKQIWLMCFNGVAKTKIVIFILFFVSFLLPSWYLSGTIHQMVLVTMQLMNPAHFFVLAFIAAIAFSMILGTSVGTLSAIGVPIISTSLLLHLPMEITAGALVSGAFVGDRTSPFSSAHQLLSHTVEITVKEQQKVMMLTTFAGLIAGFVFYGIQDLRFDIQIDSLPGQHDESLLLIKFIPPLLMISLVLFRVKIVYAFMASIASASVLALISGVPFNELIKSYWSGIKGIGGGLSHMYLLLLFITIAGAYNGILEKMNVIQPYLDRWLHSSTSLIADTVKTLLSTLLISFIAANQTLPIILTGRSFLPHWSAHYSKGELARLMGDTTMIFPGIIPWSVLAIMCSTILNVPLMSYLPYAIFLWILPCLTLLLSLKKRKETISSRVSNNTNAS